jgi:hypothetical protein
VIHVDAVEFADIRAIVEEGERNPTDTGRGYIEMPQFESAKSSYILSVDRRLRQGGSLHGMRWNVAAHVLHLTKRWKRGASRSFEVSLLSVTEVL